MPKIKFRLRVYSHSVRWTLSCISPCPTPNQSVGAASQLRTSSALYGPKQGPEPLAAQGRQHHGKELEYSLNVAATSYWRGYQVGKSYPAELSTFVLFGAIKFFILAFLIGYNPIPALLLFVLPKPMGLFITALATFEHSSGLSTDNPSEASFNKLNKRYTLFTGNLGYHTAHHHYGELHWSKLPKLHSRPADKIPDRLIRRTSF